MGARAGPRPSADRKFCPQTRLVSPRGKRLDDWGFWAALPTRHLIEFSWFPLKARSNRRRGRSHGEFSPRFCLASCGFHVRAARFSSTGSARRIFLLRRRKNNIPIPRNLAGELRRCAIRVIFNRWMETSLGLDPDRGAWGLNLLDAFPFQNSNHVAVAISRSKKKSRDPARAPSCRQHDKCLLSQTARRSSTFCGLFQLLGGLVGQ